MKGVVPIGRESYNPIVATYFTKDEHEHYILCLGYLIAKAIGRRKVAKLEALMDIHYNKKCPCTPSDFTRFRVNSLVVVNGD
jgi:hypothetical protein